MNLIRRNPSALGAYRPGTDLDQFGRMVENMFEDFFAPMAQGMPHWAGDGALAPRLNIRETDASFDIEAELPGVAKEDIKVSIDGQRVQIEAECHTSSTEREGEKLVLAERSARKYMRSFMLPQEVDDGAAQAHLENGVLHLALPKKQSTPAKRLTIN